MNWYYTHWALYFYIYIISTAATDRNIPYDDNLLYNNIGKKK